MTLAKGQEALKALLGNKQQVKKKKKRIGVATLGRRFEGEARRVLEFPPTSEEGTSKGNAAVVPSESEAEEWEAEEDEDYSEQQYSPADDKYKGLEDRLAAMELQRVPGLDFEDLGLIAGIVIPPVVPQNLPSHFTTRNPSFRHFLIFQIGSRIGQTDFSRQSNKN